MTRRRKIAGVGRYDGYYLLQACIPHELADELRALAHDADRSVSAEVRRAIRAHLEANKREGDLE